MFHRAKTEGNAPAPQNRPAADRRDGESGVAVAEQPPVMAAAARYDTSGAEIHPATKKPEQKQAETRTTESRATETRTIDSKVEEKKMSKEEQEKVQPRGIDIPGHSAGYQPPHALQPPRNLGTYNAGPYSTSSMGTTGFGAQDKSGQQGRRLVIGDGITISGEIDACDYLVIEGTVEAALKGASVLEVAESGTFYGTVEINEAMIAGRFEGDLTVNGRLTITSTGSVTGSIAYKELAIESGAVLDGKASPLAGKAAAAPKKDAKPVSPGKLKAPGRNDNAGEGNELPFAGAASAAAE